MMANVTGSMLELTKKITIFLIANKAYKLYVYYIYITINFAINSRV